MNLDKVAPVLLPDVADPRLGPILEGLTACVCAQLTAIGRPPCACCLVWGDGPPAADFCGCDCDGGRGQAWVRLDSMQPRQATGSAINAGKGGPCRPVRWTAVVEAGVYRCVTAGGPNGEAPSCEERSADAWGLVADLRALRMALTCCAAVEAYPVEALTARPLGPEGGCAGAIAQITIDL